MLSSCTQGPFVHIASICAAVLSRLMSIFSGAYQVSWCQERFPSTFNSEWNYKRIYKIFLISMFFSYCLNPVSLRLSLLLSGSVESILLYRHPDSGLCCGSGLLLWYSTWRYTTFSLFLFYYLFLTFFFLTVYTIAICALDFLKISSAHITHS